MERIARKDLLPPIEELLQAALAARVQAYCPYSNYKVGAALRGADGVVYAGCNVESADYTLTTHAEIQALNRMNLAGERRLQAIVVVVKSAVGWGMPCGLCRQKIREFGGPEVTVYGVNLDPVEEVHTIYRSNLAELLPFSFGPDFL